MSDIGIKMSKDGYDIKTATLLQQSFNSEKNCLKIIAEGNASFTGTSGSITIAHDLGYVPAWLVWYQLDGLGNWYPQYTVFLRGINGKYPFVAPYTNTTNLVINISVDVSATIEIYYMLFIDPGY